MFFCCCCRLNDVKHPKNFNSLLHIETEKKKHLTQKPIMNKYVFREKGTTAHLLMDFQLHYWYNWTESMTEFKTEVVWFPRLVWMKKSHRKRLQNVHNTLHVIITESVTIRIGNSIWTLQPMIVWIFVEIIVYWC